MHSSDYSTREQQALTYLPEAIRPLVTLLGEGGEGVVFHDAARVYKVYDHLAADDAQRIAAGLQRAAGSPFFYPIERFEAVERGYVMVYPYEPVLSTEPLRYQEWQSFLADLWCRQVVLLDIKPKNFIRTRSGLKLIDYNLYPYTDNYFLNTCVRAFVYAKFLGAGEEYINKLVRSAINQFDLPELAGVQEFTNRVFLQAIYQSSATGHSLLEEGTPTAAESEQLTLAEVGNFETLFYRYLRRGRYIDSVRWEGLALDPDGYFSPTGVILGYHPIHPFREPVSLVIKACAQDCQTLYANVKHIIRQLVSPHSFCEYILALDTKTGGFLREFNPAASWEALIEVAERLVAEGLIDRYIIMPEAEACAINARWFGIASPVCYSVKGAPVTPQLYLFEQVRGKYVLQMDSDVMIGREDRRHPFLEEMVRELERHPEVVSVGFNIYQPKTVSFAPYNGYKGGGYVPEVRLGLFDLERMKALRPFPNAVVEGRWHYTWFRAMHQRQKEVGVASIRGGDRRSFYIHPQNYRKSRPEVWLTIQDRVEQGYLPAVQEGAFDCAGSYYDWGLPLRQEPYVFLTTVRNISYPRLLRMFASVLAQRDKWWGWVIIDDASDNGLSLLLAYLVAPFRERITLIRNGIPQGALSNHFKGIHYFIHHPETVVITLDGDDALLGDRVLSQIAERYERQGADVVIGRVYQNYRLQAHYRYPANFVSPRACGGNVWQHIRSFRKKLFDSLELWELKRFGGKDKRWLELGADYAFMVPIVEMSQNPQQLEQFTYYYERDVAQYTAEREATLQENLVYILNLPRRSPQDVVSERRYFAPNLNRIEIDITYRCNLGCRACNRSCAQAPTTEQISVERIKSFVNESIAAGKCWEFINVLGGEPTLHPQLAEILSCLIKEYIRPHAPTAQIQIVSNGYTAASRQQLAALRAQFPELLVDYASFKTSNTVDYFTPFNDAPVDDPAFAQADYTAGCWVARDCGVNLNPHGYYACSVCGAIDRITSDNAHAIPSLAAITPERLRAHLDAFCRYCGNFKHYAINQGNCIPRAEKAPFTEEVISPTWEALYAAYKRRHHEA